MHGPHSRLAPPRPISSSNLTRRKKHINHAALTSNPSTLRDPSTLLSPSLKAVHPEAPTDLRRRPVSPPRFAPINPPREEVALFRQGNSSVDFILRPSLLTHALSAGASPSTSSPTGNITKIAVAQVLLLLSTIKEDRDDPHKWDAQTEQLRRLIDEHGMEVFSRYLTRLVASNAPQVFNRPGGQGHNHHLLVAEVRKISTDFEQARRIAESIETGTEDIFRDFDLSTFMEHFGLDAFEKTVMALAFKLGPRQDLKTKADAILSTNFPTFVNILSRTNNEHGDLPTDFIAELLDRFIQAHPPNFNAAAKKELEHNVLKRYAQLPDAKPPPSQVLAAMDLIRVLADKPANTLALYIHRSGRETSDFTLDEDTCVEHLQKRPPNIQLSEEQVSIALTYTTISQTPRHNPSVLVAALRRVLPPGFRWQDVVSYFDHSGARITSPQFLRLYHALLPIARDSPNFDISSLWGGEWENPETQLSFLCAFLNLRPDQLDATTIPGLKATISIEEYANSREPIQETAKQVVRKTLVSERALSAVFSVALHSVHASQSTEAKRLFQDVVINNLPTFVVSAFGVPKPWPSMAEDTLISLFDGFLSPSPESDFVLDSLWRRDKGFVVARFIDAHGMKPMLLPAIFEHVIRHGWLEEIVSLPNGFGLDIAAFAHGENFLDLHDWGRKMMASRSPDVTNSIFQFLMIKASQEIALQRHTEGAGKNTTPLQVRTVSAMLQILEESMPKISITDLITVQRQCITAYPRLINYGEGYDDIIDANGRDGNSLPATANSKMEEHYKKMYSDDIEVRNIVDILDRYKRSRDPLEQDVFACMIHGLFDEYSHYVDYPLEALATTAVLFGGIISHKLISDLPLHIALGMILEAVRDHRPDESMYKFGLQALMQLFGRLHEWPGFCEQLRQIPGLQGTDAWKKANEVVQEHEREQLLGHNGGPVSHPGALADALTNGGLDEVLLSEQHPPPFTAVGVDPLPTSIVYEDPDVDTAGKIQFALNNVTDTTLQGMFKELRELLELRHQQWFASHLVEERAKMQPNYHQVYLELVSKFEDKALWAEVLRETYISVSRMLNSELTMQNPTERTHLKNLGGWLGLLTLARDKPIKHRNIAFKQLLIEAHDTKRLIVVIPFVCKVLISGANSNVFRPPNPWLMDIIHLLIELYHNAELKLNLKFEIEVLCKGLDLDHKSIEPSGEILNRVPAEDVVDLVTADALDGFESLSLNGMPGTGNVMTAHPLPSIPDLGPSLTIPQTEVVAASTLHEIVRKALTMSLQGITGPVVDRSVTIAAISTQQMIHKDFATEPDENKVRTAAINMVKSTAGSLALVTCKEPLKGSFLNHIRTLAADLPQGLPEGIIMLCVNSNLDLASGVVEKVAEERAVPEIEELLETEMEARRRHKASRPNDPYMDPGLSRWAMTIPHPYKLNPAMGGLNAEQMAIYDDFARQPRAAVIAPAPSLLPSTSDARSVANDVLADQYNAVPSIPTPAETPAMPHLGAQLQHYPQAHGGVTNGRQTGASQLDNRSASAKFASLLEQLSSEATSSPVEHFGDLSRGHNVLNCIDALAQFIIKTQQTSEEFVWHAARVISERLLQVPEDSRSLLLESLVHVLETVRKIGGPAVSQQVRTMFHQQPGTLFLNIPLIAALLGTDLLDWRSIDTAMAKALEQRKEGSLEFLEELMDLALLNDQPLALYADFVRSLEEAWTWIAEEQDIPLAGQRFKGKVLAPPPALPPTLTQAEVAAIQLEQMEYVFDEWVHLCNNPAASEKAALIFVQQMRSRGVIGSKEDLFIFVRQAIDKSVERYDTHCHIAGTTTELYQPIDALARMIMIFVKSHEETTEGPSTRAAFLDSFLSLGVLVLNNHHVKRGDNFNQRVFFRFFSMLLHKAHSMADELTENDRNRILIKFATRFYDLRPALYPGFLFAWMSLIAHRALMPVLLSLPHEVGWPSFAKLLQHQLSYLGDLLKPLELSPLAKDIYQATLKLMAILHHDFPEFLAAHHVQLAQCLPVHVVQLLNIVLMATPVTTRVTDPFQPGLKLDRLPDAREPANSTYDAAGALRQAGLIEIVEQALQHGPSEDAIAHIKNAISQPSGESSGYGNVPLNVARPVIDALVTYIGNFAINRALDKGDPIFTPATSDIKTLYMLATELAPEARYFLLNSMANELRYTNSSTVYFIQALLEIFGHDLTDPEETDIRQQLTRILLERMVGFWPQPWGLMVTVIELVKNDKFHLFELPFVQAAPEVRRLFEEKVIKLNTFQ
ncbi:hypothetical protein OQA88_9645 [Cercophora sp. LCS_1]